MINPFLYTVLLSSVRLLLDQNQRLRDVANQNSLIGTLVGIVVARPGTTLLLPLRGLGRAAGWVFGWGGPTQSNGVQIPFCEAVGTHHQLHEYTRHINNEMMQNGDVHVFILSKSGYLVIKHTVNTVGLIIIFYLLYRITKSAIRKLRGSKQTNHQIENQYSHYPNRPMFNRSSVYRGRRTSSSGNPYIY